MSAQVRYGTRAFKRLYRTCAASRLDAFGGGYLLVASGSALVRIAVEGKS